MENQVKRVREQLGLTQEDLSKKSGISRSVLANIENNRANNYTAKTMIAIADALNKRVDELFFVTRENSHQCDA